MCNACGLRVLSPWFCASSLQHKTWIYDYEGWVVLLRLLLLVASCWDNCTSSSIHTIIEIYNTITWNIVLKPLISIQLRIELHSDSSNGILTMPQHAAAVNVNWWYGCFTDIVLWMFVNISILYTHFVKRIFSTYCIARVWYELCPKKKRKKRNKENKTQKRKKGKKKKKKRKKVVERGRL